MRHDILFTVWLITPEKNCLDLHENFTADVKYKQSKQLNFYRPSTLYISCLSLKRSNMARMYQMYLDFENLPRIQSESALAQLCALRVLMFLMETALASIVNPMCYM